MRTSRISGKSRRLKKWSDKEKVVLKTVKVKEATYKELIKMVSVLQLEVEQRVSFDDVISYLIQQIPESEVSITSPKEEENHSKSS